jgi:hypothetical protein
VLALRLREGLQDLPQPHPPRGSRLLAVDHVGADLVERIPPQPAHQPEQWSEGGPAQAQQRGGRAEETGILDQTAEGIEQEIGAKDEKVRREDGEQREHDPEDRDDGDAGQQEEAEKDLEGSHPR